MAHENTDVQWTVICRSSLQKALGDVLDHARTLGWSFEDLEIKDLDGTTLPTGDAWPSETLGSAKYRREKDGRDTYSLFWSAYSDGRLCKITGGLYIKQYADDHAAFETACHQALDDLRRLFDGDEVLCIVLSLEDDEGIDVGPGIVGSYRPSVWRAVSETPLEGITLEASEKWVEVRPRTAQDAGPKSVFAMAEETTETIQRIQSVLEAEFWGTQEATTMPDAPRTPS